MSSRRTAVESALEEAPLEALEEAPLEERGEAPVDGSGRPMRADARRNYERLVAAAKKVFAADGGGACMEAIAREAGVGVGTLYRHFPKRIDVVEAVYRTDVDQLVADAERFVAELDPWGAVVTFLEAFVRYAQTKRTFLSELQEAFEKQPEFRLRSRERIEAAMALVIDNARRAGVIRADIDGADLMALVSPMCTLNTLSEDQCNRLLGTILDGLHTVA
ncbi:MAG TPA: TetR/AcrR family transcriptional regulator [Acidimicrobiales bacterium]|nr:TetR/AcrR family transcriptional regulator [Acidimicrobiales bacterium]